MPSARGEHGLLSMAFSPHYAQNHLFYVDYTDLHGDTHVDELSSVDPSYEHELLFVQQPYPNHKGGQPESREPARQAAPHRPEQVRRHLADGRPGPAKPVAVLIRPDDRQPLDRRRRRRPLRGGRLPPAAAARHARELRLEPLRRLCALQPEGRDRARRDARRPDVGDSHDDGGCGVIGGYVYRGTRVPAARGRYVFGDLCTGIVSSFKVGPKGRASTRSGSPAS